VAETIARSGETPFHSFKKPGSYKLCWNTRR